MNRKSSIRLAAAVLLFATTWAAEALAQGRGYRPRHADPDSCHFYARDEAWRYAPPGAGALGGAARGAARGAAFGAIVGGSRAARRGAAAGAALGVIANGARREREREYAYQRAFDDCMDGFRG